MRKCIVQVAMGFIVILGLTGCGGGGTESSPSPVQAAENLITNAGWYFDNAPPDISTSGATCFLNIRLYYSESIDRNDIEGFSIAAPNGWQWTIPAAKSLLGTCSNGKPCIGGNIWYGENINTFPLAGSWTAVIKLRNGTSSNPLQLTLHEPGSTSDATHQYLYSKEDWRPATNPSQYIAALARFPSQGFTVQYSAINGGKITTTGLSAVMAGYLAAEPRANNLFCWLYDANKGYLGHTTTQYSTIDHSSTNLITADSELSIVPQSTTPSNADLSTVKYIRFVYTDGAQYQPSSYTTIDYRSISSLIPVN